MAKAPIIAQWIELANGSMSDAPPKTIDGRHHYWLFLNYCEVREHKAGPRISRTLDVKELVADDRDELDRQVAAFAEREDVRLLRDDIETNDRDALPSSTAALPSLIDGMADIYKRKE